MDASMDTGLRCIVKLGGAAITCKDKVETINDEVLRLTSSQIRQAMIQAEYSSLRVPGMDWSRQPGLNLDLMENADKFQDDVPLKYSKFIVVHGAGSFGHFQASKAGIHTGGLHRAIARAGFVATRISVTSLNLDIVRALAREGVLSIGMPPFACGWTTHKRNIALCDTSQVANVINAGFVPVLHGDAVLDDALGCTILSGDLIIRHLAETLKPAYVVFLTDVLGLYDRPPLDSSAVLLTEIAVNEDGSWRIVNPQLERQVEFTMASHDTTGGMLTKINEASLIAKLGIDVFIVKAGTEHALKALKGEGGISCDWVGTIIRSSHSPHGIQRRS